MQWLGVRTRGSFYFIRPLTVHGAACVAMEWPPRKFHPRRNPLGREPGGPIPDVNTAQGLGMTRDLRRLNIPVYERQAVDDLQFSNDLNEEIPPLRKRWRRQNLVHFDIDPQNSMRLLLPIIDER